MILMIIVIVITVMMTLIMMTLIMTIIMMTTIMIIITPVLMTPTGGQAPRPGGAALPHLLGRARPRLGQDRISSNSSDEYLFIYV